ncbi:MAG: DUF2189 domain-containing protein [Minisyncoccota bacterium]
MKKTFSAFKVLEDAWKLFLINKNFYLKTVLVFGFIAIVADLLAEDKSMKLVDIILSIISTIASFYGSVILMKGSLLISSGKTINNDVYNLNISTILQLIFASILTGIGTIIGMILLIVPGIIFAVRSMFTQYIILDEGIKVVDAIKKSIAVTKGYFWSLARLGLCIGLLSVIAIFPLFGFGFIILIPVSIIALSLVYRKMQVTEPGLVSTTQI